MTILKFDLVNNAKDSLRNAVHALTWSDETSSNKYKHAILSIFHCLELLLKERLRKVNPALVWDNIDKYPSMSANTVGIDKAISRLEKIVGISLKEDDIDTIKSCRNLRNIIQHFEFEIPEKEAKVTIGKTLSVIFEFASEELGFDLDEDFKNDDTWNLLVEDFYEFAEAHGKRLSELVSSMGGPVATCYYCGQETVDLILERCKLCGREAPDEKTFE